MSARGPAIQDLYPDDVAHCYGCGRLNPQGHQLKTYWTGGEGVARFLPRPEHLSIQGFAYGGLIASLIDCHGIAVAAAQALVAGGGEVGIDPTPRYVTAALQVTFRAPTPIGFELELRGRVREASARKGIVDVELTADGVVTATGEVVAVRMPESMARRPAP